MAQSEWKSGGIKCEIAPHSWPPVNHLDALRDVHGIAWQGLYKCWEVRHLFSDLGQLPPIFTNRGHSASVWRSRNQNRVELSAKSRHIRCGPSHVQQYCILALFPMAIWVVATLLVFKAVTIFIIYFRMDGRVSTLSWTCEVLAGFGPFPVQKQSRFAAVQSEARREGSPC